MSINDKLKEEIRQGLSLKKVDPAELKAREEEKKKRADELKRIEERLKKGEQ